MDVGCTLNPPAAFALEARDHFLYPRCASRRGRTVDARSSCKDDEVLPTFTTAARTRPVALVAPALAGVWPPPAASVAVEATPTGPLTLTLASGDTSLSVVYDGRSVRLRVTTGSRTSEHRSRRHGRTAVAPARIGLALTGSHLTAFSHEDGAWVGRARVDLRERVDARDESWLAGLTVAHEGAAADVLAGPFGQLGLRDPRLVSHADGAPYLLDGELVVTMTSAGPGFFGTAHASVWSLHPETLALGHRGDLYFRRPGRAGVYADHALHLVRDGGSWLVATSTWDDFEPRRADARVAVNVARSDADLLAGQHVLDTERLDLPTDGLRSVGVWDPHLVRDGADGWLVGYVSARRFFDFHPVVATGPSLDALTLRAASTVRRATEGTTLLRVDEEWRVLASDGRDNPRALRATYPVFDLDLRQLGTVDAPYPTNIPWPTVVETAPGAWLMIGFDGEPCGGPLMGYGTHGAVRIARGGI
jgi:hypothetical protein